LPAEACDRDALAAAVASADGIVNASPVGMHGHPGAPLPTGWLRAGTWLRASGCSSTKPSTSA
jgi:shikimate 5-dehydrogenase